MNSLVKEELEFSGYAVDVAASKIEALEKLAANHGDYDVILQDFVLETREEGKDLLKQIDRRYPDLAVILYTGINPQEAKKEAPTAYSVKVKPLDFKGLYSTVNDIIEQKNVYNNIAKNFKLLTRADFCVVRKLDRRTSEFTIEGVSDRDVLTEDEYESIFKLNLDLDRHKQLFQEQRPIHLSDLTQMANEGKFELAEIPCNHDWSSLISVPLYHQSRILGLVNAYRLRGNNADKSFYADLLKSYLKVFSGQAADSIRKSEQLRRAQSLRDITQDIADNIFHKDGLVHQILKQALDLAESKIGWIYLWDPIDKVLKIEDAIGVDRNKVDPTRKLGEGITGLVADKGVTEVVDDISLDERQRPMSELDEGSEIGVPIRRLDKTIGVLVVKNEMVKAFNSDDVDVLTGLAAAAAVSIEQAKLLKHQSELSDTALTNDIETLYQKVVDLAKDLTGADATLWLVETANDPSKSILKIAAVHSDMPIENKERYRKTSSLTLDPQKSITAYALNKGEVEFRGDIQNEDTLPRIHFLDEAKEFRWNSFLAAPLIGRDNEKLGSITLYGKNQDQFGEPHKRLMESFANQVSIALQQHNQSQALQAVIKTGNRLARKIAIEPIDIIKRTVDEGRKLLRANIVVIFPYDFRIKDEFDKEMIQSAGLDGEKFIDPKPRDGGLAKFVEDSGGIVVEDINLVEVYDLNKLKLPTKASDEAMRRIWESNFIKRKGVQAFIGVPLHSDNEDAPIGIIYFDFLEARSFTRQYLRLVQVFTNQAAAILQSARLHQDVVRKNKELNQIHHATLSIFEKEKLEDRLNAIVNSAISSLGLDPDRSGGKVYRAVHKGSKGNFLKLVSFTGIDKSLMNVGDEIPYGTGAAGQVAITEKHIIIDDYTKYEFNIDDLKEEFRACIEVPLFAKDELIGVLAVIHKDKDWKFTEEYDLDVLKRLGSKASLAISNSELLEQTRKQRIDQTEAIQKIASSFIGAETEQELFDQICKLTWQLFSETDFVDFWLFEPASQSLSQATFEKRSNVNFVDPIAPMNLQDGIIGLVARERQPVYAPDVALRHDYRCFHKDEHVSGCQYSAPVILDDQTLLGVLNIEHPLEDALFENDQKLIAALANFLAVAVSNLRSRKEQENQVERLEKLQSVSAEILGYERDPNIVLTQIVSSIQTFFKDSTCAIRTYEKYPVDLFGPPVLSKNSKLDSAFTSPRQDEKGVSRHVIETGKPYFIADSAEHALKKGPNIKEQIQEMRIRSAMIYPLLREGDPLGVLYIYLPSPHEPSETEKSFLSLFADQAITAIANSKTNQSLIDGISQISKSVSLENEKNKDELLDSIVKSAVYLFEKADLFQIWELSKDKNSISLTSVQDDKNRSVFDLKQGRSVIWEAVKQRELQNVPDTSKEDLYAGQKIQPGSELVVPIFYRQNREIFGVLNIELLGRTHAFGDYDEKLATAIAELLSTALDNRDLIQQKQMTQFGLLSSQVLHRMNQALSNLPAQLSRVDKILKQGEDGQSRTLAIVDESRMKLLDMAENVQAMERKNNLIKSQTHIPIDLNKLILNFVGSRNKRQIHTRLEPKLPVVSASPEHILSVMENLVNNAIDAISSVGDGTILIVTDLVVRERTFVSIAVVDNGVGISEKNQKKIFNLGYSTKQNGWGIGLYLDHYYAQSIGGDLTFESELNKGSTFQLTIPIHGD